MKTYTLFIALLAMLQNATAQQNTHNDDFFPSQDLPKTVLENPTTPDNPLEMNIIDWVSDRDGVGAYPNPSLTTTNIVFKEIPQHSVRIMVYEGKGSLRWTDLSPAGNKTYILDMTGWLSGIYYVHAVINRKPYTIRVVKN